MGTQLRNPPVIQGYRTEIRPNFTLCARENEVCNAGSGATIIYTANINPRGHPNDHHGDWNNPNAIINIGQPGRINCDNATFGDVAPGVPKLCYTDIRPANIESFAFNTGRQDNTIFYIVVVAIIFLFIYAVTSHK